MIATILKRIEKKLFQKGFTSPLIRQILCVLILINGISFTAGALLAVITLWPFYFGIGAALATANFWHIAKFAQKSVYQAFSPMLALGLFLGFTMRLLLSALVLFMLIVMLHAPVIPLVAGLTSSVAVITLWGLLKLSSNPV